MVLTGSRDATVHRSYLNVYSLKASIIVLVLVYIGSYNDTCTGVVFVGILPLLCIAKNYLWPHLHQTSFYTAWTVASFVLILIVFEMEVVPYLEILVYENAAVSALAAGAVCCAAYVRYHSPSQVYLSSRQLQWSHISYISWLHATLSSRTRPVFIVGCALGVCALVYGAQLSTTTICHPALFNDMILLPDDCSDVYSDG